MAKGSVEDFRPEYPDDQVYFSEDDLEAIIRAAGGLPDGQVDHQRPAEDGSTLITVSVPRRIALKERLEDAARYWDITRQYKNRPTAVQTTEEFKDIEKFANAISIKLQLDRYDFSDDALEKLPRALRDGLEDQAQKDVGAVSVPQGLANGQFTRNIDILQPSGADLVVDAIRGVYRLRNWSRALSNRTPDATPRTERHEGDPCLNELFKQLALTWMDIFECGLRTSVGAQGSEDEGEAGGPLVRFIRACLEPLLADRTPSDKAIRARICRLRPSLLRSSAENI